MFTQHDRFRCFHEALFTTEEPEHMNLASSGCVEAYLDNRAIWDELNYYKANAKILDKHPIFEIRVQCEELRKLNSAELSRKKNNLYINVIKTKNLLAAQKDSVNTENRIRSITIKTKLMAEIDNILKSR